MAEPDPAIDLAASFKAAMRRLASTVSIVTTAVAGRRSGMTATAVTSLCTAPPSLLVCVNRSASIHPDLATGVRFCVNILGSDHGEVSLAFGGKMEPATRFGVGDWADVPDEVPYLADALTNIFCTVDRTIDYGTHSIIIGRVEQVLLRPNGDPLVYGDGRFLSLQCAA